MGNGCSTRQDEQPADRLRELPASPLLTTSNKIAGSDETFGASQLSSDAQNRNQQQQKPNTAGSPIITQPKPTIDESEGALHAPDDTTGGATKKSPLRRPRRKSLPAGIGAGPGSTFHSVATRAISPDRRDSGSGITEAVQQYENNRWSPLRRLSHDQQQQHRGQHHNHHHASRGFMASISPSESPAGSGSHLPRRPTHVVVPTNTRDTPHGGMQTIGHNGVPVVPPDGWYSTNGSVTSSSAMVRSGVVGGPGSRSSRVAGGRGVGMSFGSLDGVAAAAAAAALEELQESRKLSTDNNSRSDAVLTFSMCAPAPLMTDANQLVHNTAISGSSGGGQYPYVPTGNSISIGISSGELPPLASSAVARRSVSV